MIVYHQSAVVRLRFRYVPVHKFPNRELTFSQRFKQGFAHSASAPRTAMFQPSDMVVYSRNSKLPANVTAESMKKRLTCRMMTALKPSLHSNDAALASSQITTEMTIHGAQDSFCAVYRTHPYPGDFTQRCVIAAHIIHQMPSLFSVG